MIVNIKMIAKDTLFGATKRQIQGILASVFRIGMEHYHAQFVPLHFRNLATNRYGYRPREGERGGKNPPGSKYYKKSYTWRKLREKGHTRPLEWTGLTKQRAMVRDVRANSKGARLVSQVPTLNRRPWMWEEFCREIPEEQESVRKAMEAALLLQFSDMHNLLTYTYRIA